MAGLETFKEEFSNKYEAPYIPSMIVGFCGIDPSRKNLGELKISDIPHEELDKLLGGNTDGHYHFTEEEWEKLKKLISVLFPDGAVDPVFPNVPVNPPPTSDDNNPDEPNPNDDNGPFGGLPAATPPLWEHGMLPGSGSSQTKAWSGVHKMYYGTIPDKSNKIIPVENALLVPVMKNNSTTKYWIYTQDLNNWVNVWFSNSIADYGEFTANYICREFVKGSSTKYYLYFLGYPTNNKGIYFRARAGSSSTYGTVSNSSSIEATAWLAGCYSPHASMYVFASQDGHICRMKDTETSVLKENITCGLSVVNPGCMVYLPTNRTICIAGPDGTATSSTGTSWSVHSNNLNLVDMTWRDDLENACLFARGKDTKLFYASADGIDWVQVNNTPIPLDEVAAVAFCPELGWFCAIGGNSKYAYFSKNLEKWIESTVDSSPVHMGSIIWMSSTQKFVLMPTEGTYYYTFSPADWK